MRSWLPGVAAGVLFGAGLALSDMVNPARVQAFLDVAGKWDPTLLWVMAAAIPPSAAAYALSRRMARPLLGQSFAIPASRTVDPRLMTGAALFGAGWGLVGYCPGPAIAGLALGGWQPWLFVVAMLGGMLVHRFASGTPSTDQQE